MSLNIGMHSYPYPLRLSRVSRIGLSSRWGRRGEFDRGVYSGSIEGLKVRSLSSRPAL